MIYVRAREFALDRAIAVTQSQGHRAVSRVADKFTEFLEADGGGPIRERALALATRPGVDLPAHAIVATATRYLETCALAEPRATGNETRTEERP
jgi:hypothetical protein